MKSVAFKPGGQVVCKLSIPLPKGNSYLQRASSTHPNASFELRSYLPLEKGSDLSLYRVLCPNGIAEVLKDLDMCEDLQHLDVIHQDAEYALIQVRAKPSWAGIIIEAGQMGAMPNFPFWAKGGLLLPVFAASEERIRSLIPCLESRFPGTVVLSLGQEPTTDYHLLLTTRQEEIFRMAFNLGYWETPRRVSISLMAEFLGVSKSTLSETLSAVENKLLRHLALPEG